MLRPTKREYLPQKYPIRPDVALHSVDAVKNALRRHPLHWQASLHPKHRQTTAVHHPLIVKSQQTAVFSSYLSTIYSP